MGIFACRMVIVVVCIGFLSMQTERVCGLRSIDLALRSVKGQPMLLRNSRILTGDDTEVLQPSPAPAPSMVFDPNQSSKRRVRRGSDPIHNRW
ncbi:CLE45p like [Actinidia chinensis var. chinensis]|uniref:CLE45p like n=1 Tax=Actinidia chinensis var. chinensis TaxID=1590841 RepID=A0A2R6QH19_ACTCC|nr:CLE45p like [Actinidia chinensis var. chinensis]